MKKRLTALLLTVIVALSVFAVSAMGMAPASEGYRFAWAADVPGLNAHDLNFIAVADWHAWTHSGLFRRVPTPDGLSSQLIPDIASELPYTVDDEGLVWHVPLRPYARFHNGTPITAHTFVDSYRFLLCPVMGNVMWNFLAGQIIQIENAAAFHHGEIDDWDLVGIRAYDDHTLEIRTALRFRVDQFMTHFLDRSTFPVYVDLYRELMSDEGDYTTYGTTLDNWVGAGPFIPETWVPDALHVFRRNADHWLADYFHWEQVQARIVGDQGTRMQLFEAGEIDLLNLEATDLPQFLDDPRLLETLGVSPTHIDINNLNPDQPILASMYFRRALYWAINRNVLSNLVNARPGPTYIGYEAGAFLGDGTLFRISDVGINNLPLNSGFDPDLAAIFFELALQEAGVDSVSLRFLYVDVNVPHRVAGEFLQESLPQIFGEDRFELVLTPMPLATIGAARNWRYTYDWDLTIVGWGTGAQRNFPHQAFQHMINPDTRPNPFLPDTFLERWHAANELTFADVLDYDALFAAAAELESMWVDYAVNIPLWHPVTFRLLSERVDVPMQQHLPAIEHGWHFGWVVE